jgi:arylsulfatase A-like enzyme
MKLWLAIQLLTIRFSSASSSGPEQARLGGPEAEIPLARSKPNIVFIITDDQDLHLRSLDYLPYIKKHLIDQGLLYKRHYCTTALCCPSRVSLWTGKQAHNTNVTDVSPPYGKPPAINCVKQGGF